RRENLHSADGCTASTFENLFHVAECLGRGAHSQRAHVRRVRIAGDEVCESELEQPESRILRPPTKASVDRRRCELDERALVNDFLYTLWSRLDIHVSLRMRHNSRDASSAKLDQLRRQVERPS